MCTLHDTHDWGLQSTLMIGACNRLTCLVPGGIEEGVVLHAGHSQCVRVEGRKASVLCTEAWDPKPRKEAKAPN